MTAESLMQRWKLEAQQLAGAGLSMEMIVRQSLVTPSCGAGSLSPAAALRVLELLPEVSKAFGRNSGCHRATIILQPVVSMCSQCLVCPVLYLGEPVMVTCGSSATPW